jgi:hypothetical protein
MCQPDKSLSNNQQLRTHFASGALQASDVNSADNTVFTSSSMVQLDRDRRIWHEQNKSETNNKHAMVIHKLSLVSEGGSSRHDYGVGSRCGGNRAFSRPQERASRGVAGARSWNRQHGTGSTATCRTKIPNVVWQCMLSSLYILIVPDASPVHILNSHRRRISFDYQTFVYKSRVSNASNCAALEATRVGQERCSLAAGAGPATLVYYKLLYLDSHCHQIRTQEFQRPVPRLSDSMVLLIRIHLSRRRSGMETGAKARCLCVGPSLRWTHPLRQAP